MIETPTKIVFYFLLFSFIQESQVLANPAACTDALAAVESSEGTIAANLDHPIEGFETPFRDIDLERFVYSSGEFHRMSSLALNAKRNLSPKLKPPDLAFNFSVLIPEYKAASEYLAEKLSEAFAHENLSAGADHERLVRSLERFLWITSRFFKIVQKYPASRLPLTMMRVNGIFSGFARTLLAHSNETTRLGDYWTMESWMVFSGQMRAFGIDDSAFPKYRVGLATPASQIPPPGQGH